MKRSVVVWRVALSALLAACSGDRASRPITVRDSAGIVIARNDLSRLTATCTVGSSPTVSIGEAEGREEYELHRVFGATRLSDGRIVLVNQGSQQIRFYDQEGRFIKAAGRAGEGPGEFRRAFYLSALPGDTIWVGDYRPWQFLVFAPGGEYVRTVKPTPQYLNPPRVRIVLDNGRSVLGEETTGTSRGFDLRTIALVVHGPDGALVDRIGTFANARYGQLGDDPNAMFLYPLFESFVQITGHGSTVLIGHGSSPELTLYDAQKAIRLQRIIRWTTADRAITPADVDAERQRVMDRDKDLSPEDRKRFVDPLISPERPIADQFPAFTDVMMGRDGRIWILPFRRPTASEPPRWHAFDTEGRFECTASLPELDEVLEFGRDYLLAKDRDDAGVERVVQYPLGTPTRPAN